MSPTQKDDYILSPAVAATIRGDFLHIKTKNNAHGHSPETLYGALNYNPRP